MDAKNRKRVAFLAHSLADGGAERVVSNLSISLIDHHDVELMIINPEKISYPYRGNIVSIDSGDLSDRGRFFSFNPLKLLKLFISYQKEIRRIQPDVVISVTEIPNILNLISLGKHKRIASVHSNMTMRRKGALGRLFVRVVHNNVEKTVTVSDSIASDLVNNFGTDPNRLITIYNPLNIDMIDKMKDEYVDEKSYGIVGRPLIITVGRLIEAKAHDRLLDSFCEVKSKIPGAKLLLLGDGERQDRLVELIGRLDLIDDVLMMGFQSNPFKFINKSDVFVLSSYYEGLSYVILEAMACGVAVVSVDCDSGPREIIAPDTDPEKKANGVEFAKFGVLTPPFIIDTSDKDAETALADALTRILQDESIRNDYAERGEERARDFSIDEVLPQWLELINSD